MTELIQDDTKLGPPITHKQPLPVSSTQVWELISRPGNLVDFHPFCQSNPVDNWPGVGSRDTIYYYSGLVIVREFSAWLDGIGYDLTASDQDQLHFKVFWRISSTDKDHCQLTLTIRQAVDQHSERRVRQFSRLLDKYLNQVGQGLEYHLRTGERVARNQFGSHRLFSPPLSN